MWLNEANIRIAVFLGTGREGKYEYCYVPGQPRGGTFVIFF